MQRLWIDATIGKDSNNGSLEAPFATTKALEAITDGANATIFLVQLSPGAYPTMPLKFRNGTYWTFARCKQCPSSTEGNVTILPVDHSTPVFSSEGSVGGGYGPSLTLQGITMAPGFHDHAGPLNTSMIDYPLPNSVLVDNCTIYGFSFYYHDRGRNRAFFRVHQLTIIDSDIFGFVGKNPPSGNDLRATGSGIIAVTNTLILERTSVSRNFVHFRHIYGGLFSVHNATIIDCKFEHNAGYAQHGYGLLFAWVLELRPSFGRVERSVFFNNSLLPYDGEQDPFSPLEPSKAASQASPRGSKASFITKITNATTSGCVFFAANLYGFNLTVTDSVFRRNVASAGVILSAPLASAISSPLHPYKFVEAPVSVSFNASFFDSNAAEVHGIGAVISVSTGAVIDAVDSEAASQSRLSVTNSVFVGNLAPSIATRPIVSPISPSTGIVTEDPSLIDVHFVGHVSLSNLTMLPRPEGPDPSDSFTLSSVTRIYIRYSASVSVTYIYANGITPCWGSGGLLMIFSVPQVSISNVIIYTPIRNTYTDPTQAPTNAGYDLIRVYRPEESPISNQYVTNITNLRFSGWSTPVPTSLLTVDGVFQLSITDLHMKDISSSSYVPLITLMGIQGQIEINNSSFKNLTSLIAIEAAPSSLLIHNVSIIDYANSVLPAIQSKASLDVSVQHFLANTSYAPALAFINSERSNILVSDSQFLHISAVDSVSGIGGGAFVLRATSTWSGLSSRAVFRDCQFHENEANAGAAIYVSAKSEIQVHNCSFSKNKAASGDGGAIFVHKAFPASLFVHHSDFGSNTAANGGAIAISNSLLVSKSIFAYNVANFAGGAIAFLDAPYLGTPASFNRILNTTFHTNKASDNGGAIGGMRGKGTLIVSGSLFDDNVASGPNDFSSLSSLIGKGGAIATLQDLDVRRCTFAVNLAATGGAIYLAIHPRSTKPTHMHNTTFFANSAVFMGGAMAVSANGTLPTRWNPNITGVNFVNNLVAYRGGAISFVGAYPDLRNASGLVFTTNTAIRGAALYVQQAPSPVHLGPSTMFTKNNASCCGAILFYGNISSLYRFGIGTTTIPGSELPPDPLSPTDIPIAEPFDDILRLDDNYATWGVEHATSTLDLSAALLNTSISYPVYEEPNIASSGARRIFVTYPGAIRTLKVSGTDQFGQTAIGVAGALLFSYRFECASSPAECASISFNSNQEATGPSWSQSTSTAGQTLAVAQVSFHLKPGHSAMLANPIDGRIVINARWNSLDLDSTVQDSALAPTYLDVKIQACGMGYGETLTVAPSKRSSRSRRSLDSSKPLTSPEGNEPGAYTCSICPLYSYSLNGTCARCAYDRGVQSCSGADIIAPATWWVLKDAKMNRYQSLRCAESYCGNGNECLLDRTGIMCGDCVPGRSQSITSICLDCNRPNWGMIVLAFGGLWGGVLVLHSLLAVSSGKATILIFFVQTAWSIRYQIPFVSTSAAGLLATHPGLHRFVSWILCLWPMTYLDRTVLMAVVPFIMMLQISLTFAFYHAFIRLKAFFRGKSATEGIDENLQQLIYGTSSQEGPILDDDDDEEDELISEATPFKMSRFSYSPLDQKEQDDGLASSDVASDSDGSILEFGAQDAPSVDPEPTEESSNQLREAKIYEETYQHRIQKAYFHHYRLIRTLLSLFAGTFSSVLGIVMSTLGCITLMDGQRILAAAPSVSCDSRQFKLVKTLYAVLLPWLIIVLGTMAVKLIHAYRTKTLSMADVRFGVWYEMYKPRFFAWKLSELIRRTFVSTIGNLLISEPSLRASMLCLIMLVSLTAQLIVRPYRHKLQNSLEILALCSLTLISLCVLWYVKQQHESRVPSTLSMALLIGTSVILVASFGSQFFVNWYRRFRPKTIGNTFHPVF